MYRINKDKGNNQVITLTNIETKASVIIGRLSITIMDILKEDDTFREAVETKSIIAESWDFTVSDEIGKKLAKTTFKIEKPERHAPTSDSIESLESLKKKVNKTIDAMDVLLGIAQYNN